MTLSQKQRETICCHVINHFLFDKVWNESPSEYRVNIKPALMKKGSSVGSFSLLDATILLPTPSDSYYVWAISAEDFNIGLKLPDNTWMDGETIINDYNTLLQLYSVSGAMLHQKFIHYRYNLSRSVIFIAAKKDMVRKCISDMNMLDKVYLTVYFDSDVRNDVHAVSLFKTSTMSDNLFQHGIDTILQSCSNPDQLLIYRNGIEVTQDYKSLKWQNNDYIDIIIDENIAFAVDIDIAFQNQNPVFLSKKDSIWKQLIHIPKEKNPENKIITHNTCDFWVRRRLSNTGHGRYLHRVKTDDASRDVVNQVTHNDLAIPLFVLDAYRDYLQSEEISLHMVARIHDKDNYLIREASFIDLLYTHNDDRIIEILCGNGPEEIPWWRADTLEESKFIQMLFDIPNIVTVETLKEYVQALGFYQVVNLLCQRVIDVTITDAFRGSLTFDLPLLYTGYRVIPIVYLNGKILRKDQIEYTIDTDLNQCTIRLKPEIITKPGDKLVFVLYLDGDKEIYSFVATEAQTTIEVPFEEFTVYAEDTTLQLLPVPSIADKEHTTRYLQLLGGANQYSVVVTETGARRITVAPEFVGKRIFIQNKYCSYRQMFDLTPYTNDGKTIAIPLQTQYRDDANEIHQCPVFNIQNIAVYLNGEYLVRNIDYFINTVRDSKNALITHELVIQTMDHFKENAIDYLDVVINVAEIDDISSFFVINDELRDATPVNYYFPNISLAHVAGMLERDAEYKGVYMKLPEGKYNQGDIFEIQTAIPALIKNFVLEYASNEDSERLRIMNEYFYDHYQIIPDILIMEDKHRIYSAFLNTFIHDVVSGKVPLIFDPDGSRMRDAIKPYLYLQSMDLCFTNISQLFVDFYPQYINYQITPEMKRFIDFFVKNYMPENHDPTVEVVYE